MNLQTWVGEYGYPRRYFIDLINNKARILTNDEKIIELNKCYELNEYYELYEMDNTIPILHKSGNLIESYVFPYFLNSAIKNCIIDNGNVYMLIFVCYYYSLNKMIKNNIYPELNDLTNQVIAYLGLIVDQLLSKRDRTYKECSYQYINVCIETVRKRITYERINLTGKKIFNLRQ